MIQIGNRAYQIILPYYSKVRIDLIMSTLALRRCKSNFKSGLIPYINPLGFMGVGRGNQEPFIRVRDKQGKIPGSLA